MIILSSIFRFLASQKHIVRSFKSLVVLTLLISLQISSSLANSNQWTWMNGPDGSGENPVYGTKGISAPGNTPGPRNAPATWTDADGNFWLFGGLGLAQVGPVNSSGALNDLWKYTVNSGEWTWIAGSHLAKDSGIRGTQGVASTDNIPSARSGTATCVDTSGTVWLFGGWGTSSASSGNLNDLWKYNPTTNEWTWVKGNITGNHAGIYGTKETPDPANNPGGRGGAAAWTDSSGALWVFGGTGHGQIYNGGLNDLWKFDPDTNNWTWMQGSNNVNQYGNYGTKGVAASSNMPGSRFGAVSWQDTSGNFWLFGGSGSSANWSGTLNDLWKYDPVIGQWTWMHGSDSTGQAGIYGVQGISSSANAPGGRHQSNGWMDNSGNFWLFGGDGRGESSGTYDFGFLNDLWKYNITSGEWTWVKGGKIVNQMGVFGTREVESPNNLPSGRRQFSCWSDLTGNLWLFGGLNYNSSLNDLWKFNPQTENWTWAGGFAIREPVGVYGTRGTPSPTNQPGVRTDSVSWTDTSGNLWLFGGEGYGIASGSIPTKGYLNDLWRYDRSNSQWTWMRGNNTINQNAFYNSIGGQSSSNTPGARVKSASWTDNSGNFWLFGGSGRFTMGLSSYVLNDFWKLDKASNNWICMTAFSYETESGNYGVKGQAAAENYPPSRKDAVTWTDPEGNLWLYGGHLSGTKVLSDLWKYNISSGWWTWVSGSSVENEPAVYEELGVGAPGNTPGGRENAVAWTDSDGSLWLGGGNDLWKYDRNTGYWSCMKSSDFAATFGIKGVPHPSNNPGGRSGATGWTDTYGNMWLFGNSDFSQNDLWRYSPQSGNWTWMAGDNIPYPNGIYGTKGVANAANTPGGRSDSIGWKDTNGDFWLFGSKTLNDLWRYTPGNNSGIDWQDAQQY